MDRTSTDKVSGVKRWSRLAMKSAALSVAGIVLVGCQNNPVEPPEETAVQGNAQPAESQAESLDYSPGKVINLPASVDRLDDLESIGNVLAVQSGSSLLVGSISDIARDKAEKIDLREGCADLNAADGAFYMGCGGSYLEVPAEDPASFRFAEVDAEFPITSATRLSSGELVLASQHKDEVAVVEDDKVVEDFRIGAPTDQLLAVPNANAPDGVVRTWNADTTIQNVDWKNSRPGGRLRVGVGLGQADVGSNGVVLVSDTGGKRLAVYTSSDVVRLHQFGNTAGTPWAVAWDSSRELAWVTSTDINVAEAFDISTGQPISKGTFDTVSDAQFITALDDGTIVVGSVDGRLHVVKDPEI